MRLREVLKRADELRPNALSDDLKASYVLEVEAIICDMKQVDMPENKFPQDQELLMEYPYDNIYELYLAAKIDFANEEYAMYSNDMTLYNDALSKARAWYRRNNNPNSKKNWRTM